MLPTNKPEAFISLLFLHYPTETLPHLETRQFYRESGMIGLYPNYGHLPTTYKAYSYLSQDFQNRCRPYLVQHET